MKILTLKNNIFLLLILTIWNTNLYSQEEKTTLLQDQKFELLLNEKRKINSSITVNDSYKIQIYNGESEIAKKTLMDFKKKFTNLDGTIIFSTPTYKVWIGNFKTRIEAERNLIKFKEKYPNSLLIKLNK
ncbi:MAG: SPOR domain-containing protein [Bacteroidota bacterium]